MHKPESENCRITRQGMVVCWLTPEHASQPLYMQRRHLAEQHLSSGFLWHTAHLYLSSLPAKPTYTQMAHSVDHFTLRASRTTCGHDYKLF